MYFNPHEREARDLRLYRSEEEDYDFNPHEREARDEIKSAIQRLNVILIHTSVKLVTFHEVSRCSAHLF